MLEVLPTLPIPSTTVVESTQTDFAIEEEDNPSDTIEEELTHIPATIGLVTYYNQGDSRWKDELYGPSDLFGSHGCAPTALAMIISSFTNHSVTPLDVGNWAADHGYCITGEGSRHEIIPDGLAHYGLIAKSLPHPTTEELVSAIQSGNIIIALVNKGYFTNSGHFLLFTQVTWDGKIRIADPGSKENSLQEWDPAFLLSQVRKTAQGGGPLWIVSMTNEP